MSQETRHTDPTTGGQKGRKAERFGLIPKDALGAVARVYAFGAQKYEDHNYLRGYPWSWSVDALYRHIAAWELGEACDPESGESHLAHVAWHTLALLAFGSRGLGTDDRYRPVPQPTAAPACVEGPVSEEPERCPDYDLDGPDTQPAPVVQAQPITFTISLAGGDKLDLEGLFGAAVAEALDAPPPVFVVGDRVRVVDPEDADYGRLGTVDRTDLDDDELPYHVHLDDGTGGWFSAQLEPAGGGQ